MSTSTNNSPSNNYITMETKTNKDFQNLLSIMSRADAQHDIHFLKKEFKENKGILNAFATALPSYPSISWDEEDCLKNIFINNNQYDNLEKLLDQVPDVTQTKLNKTPILFDIGFSNNTLHTFSCVKFVIESSNNKAKNLIPASGDIATNFCINTDFCGISNNAILVVDYNQHGFLSIFKEGIPSSLFHIHYVASPEVINDPAPKTSLHDAIFTPNATNGVKMNSYVQSGIENSVYSKYDSNNIGTNNNFFSEYNFILEPIRSIYTKQKAEKLITNLNIYWNIDNSNQPFTDNITDSKGENSNNTVASYILGIIRNITTNNNNRLNFDFNKKCQQKRGGDWFQALSCFDVKNRVFTNIQNRTEGAKAFPSNYPVYFVTHDRIAVSYALLMGANVIYLDYYGCVFLFKNQLDENTKSSNKSYEEGLFEMLQNQSSSSNTSGQSELSKYLSFNINYNVARENILKKEYQEIINYILNANKEIESLEIANNNNNNNTVSDSKLIKSKFIANFQSTIKKIFQHIFPMIVRYYFINSNLIDTKEDVKYIQQNQNILTQTTYAVNLKDQVLKLYQAYNRINSVYSVHGGGTMDLIENSILLWSNNVNKLDVYRSAKNLLNIESYQDKKTFDLRLLNYNTNNNLNNNEKRLNDIYIFLPYIQTIGNDLKKKIMEFINGPLLDKSMKFRNYISTGTSVFRLNRLQPNEVFFNQIANFIYETRIFLSVNPEENTNMNQVEEFIENAVESVEALKEDIGLGLGSGSEVQNEVKAESVAMEQQQQSTFQLPGINIEPFISLSTDAIVIAEDFFEITYIRGMGNMKGKNIGKFTNSTSEIEEEEPSNPSFLFQLGGFQYYESKDPNKKIKNDVSIDISIRQITWPLLTNLLISNGINNINNKKIIHYISDRENIENDSIDLNQKRTNRLEEMNQQNEMNQNKKRFKDTFIGGASDNTNTDTNTWSSSSSSNDLFTLLESINKLGKDPKKINLGYHPLLPIYMILSSMWYFVSPNLSNDCFYDSYINYFHSLEKMTDILINNYLRENLWSQSYFIGFALKNFLFESYTSEKNVQDIIDLLKVDPNKYRMYSLKNDMFGNNIAGYFLPDPKEDKTNSILFFSDLFKNFLVEKVDLSSFVENNSISLDNLPSPDEFQEQIYVLMKKIVEQIEKDCEDTTKTLDNDLVESNSNVSSLTSSLTSSSFPINTNTNTKKKIDQYGNIINIPVALPKKGIYTLKDYPNSSSSNNNSLVYNSSSSSSSNSNSNSNIGGYNKKKTKNNSNNNNNKKKTKKNRNKKRKISQKTRKVKVKVKRNSSFLTKKHKKNKIKKTIKSRKLV